MNNWLGLGLALALACGGGEEATEEESSGGEETHEHHGDHHHHHGEEHHHAEEHGEMPPALHAFHEAFAGHWHGDRSAEAVCPTVDDLKALSDAAGEEHSQHPDEVTELSASSEAAVAACASGEGWDAAFDRWHNALHGVMHTSAEHE